MTTSCARDAGGGGYAPFGVAALSDVDLVALAIGVSEDEARKVLAFADGDVRSLARATYPGLTPLRASRLNACVELGRRVLAPRVLAGPIRTPVQAANLFSDMALLEQEEMHVVGLDVRHRVVLRTCVARGTLNVVHVSPREVMRPMVRAGAAACLVAHNHPSGDAVPSDEDVDLTSRLKAAGDLVGVPVLDHVIIAGEAFYSFSEGRVRVKVPGSVSGW